LQEVWKRRRRGEERRRRRKGGREEGRKEGREGRKLEWKGETGRKSMEGSEVSVSVVPDSQGGIQHKQGHGCKPPPARWHD